MNYDPFCITLAADPRLPDGGGYQQCGYYGIKPAMRGVVENFVTKEATSGIFNLFNSAGVVQVNQTYGPRPT